MNEQPAPATKTGAAKIADFFKRMPEFWRFLWKTDRPFALWVIVWLPMGLLSFFVDNHIFAAVYFTISLWGLIYTTARLAARKISNEREEIFLAVMKRVIGDIGQLVGEIESRVTALEIGEFPGEDAEGRCAKCHSEPGQECAWCVAHAEEKPAPTT